jgi:Rieske Fe-S protein
MANKTDRRTFLGTSAALVTAATVLPQLALPDTAHADEELTADLGKVADLDSGDPVLVTAQFRDADGKVVDEAKLYVRAVKNGDSCDWVVLSAICTHLKCKIKFNDEKNNFLCPCHKSEFDLAGKVLKKPAKKDLPNYSKQVRDENGRLILRK